MGGMISHEKIYYYYWEWKWFRGKTKIINKRIDIEINQSKIKQTDADKVIRTLGLIIAPLLNWDKQFKAMKDRMRCAIYKL